MFLTVLTLAIPIIGALDNQLENLLETEQTMDIKECEITINSKDKEEALAHIKAVNRILDKYSHSNYKTNIVTNISKAKTFSEEAEMYISCLKTNE